MPPVVFAVASFLYEEYIWTDVLFFRTLNMQNARRRVEKHICPLPFDIVNRCIIRYSNPDEVCLDPFAGLFTVPYRAIALGRRGMGFELNPVSFEAGVRYCQEAEIKASSPTFFDLIDESEPQTNGYHAEELAEVTA